jgi:hypothetical protein
MAVQVPETYIHRTHFKYNHHLIIYDIHIENEFYILVHMCKHNHNHDFYIIHAIHFRIIYFGDGKGPGTIIPAYIHIKARSPPQKGEGRSPVMHIAPDNHTKFNYIVTLQCIFIGRSNNLWAEVHYIWN